jgi:bacteriorhodopsin
MNSPHSEENKDKKKEDPQYEEPGIIVQIFRVLAVLKFVFLAFYCYYYKLVVVSLVPIIASIAYVAMFINEHNILIARYTDWVLTTGIILFMILYKADIPMEKIFFLVSLNSIMMISGLFGRLEKSHANRIIWFTIGCILFIPIFINLIQISNNKNKNNEENKKNSLYTVILWCIYPIVWLLAEEEIISIETENSIIPMIDVWAKSGFCYLTLKENGVDTWLDKFISHSKENFNKIKSVLNRKKEQQGISIGQDIKEQQQ